MLYRCNENTSYTRSTQRFCMILTTEAGGARSNCSTMIVPEQFEWTRENISKFIITLQVYPALWKVRLHWYPNVIFSIFCVLLNSQFLENCCKATLASHKPGFRSLLLMPLFFAIFSSISVALSYWSEPSSTVHSRWNCSVSCSKSVSDLRVDPHLWGDWTFIRTSRFLSQNRRLFSE